MSDAEQRLDRALAALRPPPRDAAFRIAVMERLARRHFQVRIAGLSAAGLMLTGWALLDRPMVDAALASAAWTQPAAMLAAAAAVIGWSLTRLRRPI